MKIKRTTNTGFSFAEIKAQLEKADFEPDEENEGVEVRRVWLGTVFGITPSGKVYQPFACSNVAGDCPVCGGEGKREPRTGRRIRARAKRRGADFCRGVCSRGFMGVPAAQAYAARVQKARDAAYRVTDTTCSACNGMGSISAARDERWTKALEAEAEKINAFVDYQDESIFIAQCRDAEEESDGDEGSNQRDFAFRAPNTTSA